MFDGNQVRAAYEQLNQWVQSTPPEVLEQKRQEAEALFRRIGITFAVYGEGGDVERLIPFDIMPRVFTEAEWRKLEKGVKQRARALNAFLYDVYHRGEIIRAGVIPADLVYRNDAYEPAVVGIDPPANVYSHIVGIDLVRTGPGDFFVLEDNCRTPSGVSYMLENREIMMRMLPELFRSVRILPVDDYPNHLRRTLASVAPRKAQHTPVSVLLSPGAFNSAYYEHSFLADQMGIEIVEGQDLFVQGDFVYMRTTEGPKRVHVIYRRLDDSFLDPLCFRPESMLGVPGLTLVEGSAPGALGGLPTPDAVFIGGGGSGDGVTGAAMEALRPGGRLVANAVTLEMEAHLLALYARHGGMLTRIALSRAEPVGTMTGWRPAMPVTQWRWVKST